MYRIAVIGAGTAGLAAAAFLKRSGHDVIIHEQFESPRPVGAGLMLQPTGLAVLARLGLDQKAIELSSKVDGIRGHIAKSGRVIFNVSYQRLGSHVFGLGIHRHTLFSLLYEEVQRLQIPVITSSCIEDIIYDKHDLPHLVDGQQQYGPFDLIVNAQGARSPLRAQFVQVKKDKPYPYAAVWGVCKDKEGSFKQALYQRYQKAYHMIGVMPIGCRDEAGHESVAFFWSLRAKDYDAWRAAGMKAWQEYVISLWPEVEPLITQFEQPDDLSFATYGDICVKHYYNNRLVFIGDAAHATSPQLGQGANMGLLDALILDQHLTQTPDVNAALKTYSKKRRQHVRFYQMASHWLTPFFQSDSVWQPAIRDAMFGMMCKLPYISTEMVRTLAGIKTGLFSHMNPGEIHPDYELRYDKTV